MKKIKGQKDLYNETKGVNSEKQSIEEKGFEKGFRSHVLPK